MKNKELIRQFKFLLFSASAGLIEALVFTAMNELMELSYWPCYLTALVASVVWNFTLNRKFTFKSSNNVPIAMLKVAAFYAVFTPVSTIIGNHLVMNRNWNEYLVTGLNMLANLVLEYVYDRFVVYGSSIDTSVKDSHQSETENRSTNDMSHESWKCAEGITAIKVPGVLPGPGSVGGFGRTICYLIEGTEKAMLLDTGFGIGDIKTYVESLTDKPLIVVNSHMHPDHSGGNPQFPLVYISENEVKDEEPFMFPPQAIPGGVYSDAVLNAPGYRFKRIPDGHQFDLGGRVLTVYEVPGHTTGSIALHDSLTNMILAGDSLLKRVLLFTEKPLSVYISSLQRIKDLNPTDILCAHWDKPLGVDHIDRMMNHLKSFAEDRYNVEKSPWMTAGNMCVYRHGENFSEPDFIAIGVPEANYKYLFPEE